MINKRLSDETVINENRYKATMSCTKTTTTKNVKREHNIIWFNPPYSQNIKANITFYRKGTTWGDVKSSCHKYLPGQAYFVPYKIPL